MYNENDPQYRKTLQYIEEGFMMPQVEMKRKYGVCLHHSYKPEHPTPEKNYAEIFNRVHYFDNGWKNGLGYDFVITYWWDYNHSKFYTKYWSSMRWQLQLEGSHSLNPKERVWPSTAGNLAGTIVRPNHQLISICVVGNIDNSSLHLKVYDVIKEIIDLTGVRRFIFKHSDFDFKTCPGTKFNILNLYNPGELEKMSEYK